MTTKYQNRQTAGLVLADKLTSYANRDDVLVLGLPRGGVPVAFEIAKILKAPLDVLIVRKLGVPIHPELALGAIAMGGAVELNQDVIDDLNITLDDIKAVIIDEERELRRREKVYRGDKLFPEIKNKIIILVDDGMATGATMRVAIKSLRQYQPEEIIVAVPVGAKQTINEIEKLADAVICPLRPAHFNAVGAWYDEFDQTDDEEVLRCLTALIPR